MITRIPLLVVLFVFVIACREEEPEIQILGGSAEWPALSRDHWRVLILEFYDFGAPFDPERVIFGDPASEGELDALEKDFGLSLPSEFRHFYLAQDGFGTMRADGTIDWIFVPISNIPDLTNTTKAWMRRFAPELENRVLAFIDFEKNEKAGFLFSESGETSETIYTYIPGAISAPKPEEVERPYFLLDASIAGVLTEPYIPTRLLENTEGEQAEALKP